ncbi:hypothetical protein [Isoptericola sp. NPDC058082]|uniref:hypothetical protein n=1 Tax=Isoptericola sp. NPDC058082 TaxID=3346331 RepID=UPI0036E7A58E
MRQAPAQPAAEPHPSHPTPEDAPPVLGTLSDAQAMRVGHLLALAARSSSKPEGSR